MYGCHSKVAKLKIDNTNKKRLVLEKNIKNNCDSSIMIAKKLECGKTNRRVQR